MTADSSPLLPSSPTMCARHPDVETGLSCGRCGTPICPRCLVYTPAGTRCPDCAAIGRPRMYVFGAMDYARALPTAIVVGSILGIASAFLLSPGFRIGLFPILIALAVGYGVGIAVGEALNLTTGRKRGREIQLVAAGAVIFAWLTRFALFMLAGASPEIAFRDISGLLMVVIAASVATNRLR